MTTRNVLINQQSTLSEGSSRTSGRGWGVCHCFLLFAGPFAHLITWRCIVSEICRRFLYSLYSRSCDQFADLPSHYSHSGQQNLGEFLHFPILCAIWSGCEGIGFRSADEHQREYLLATLALRAPSTAPSRHYLSMNGRYGRFCLVRQGHLLYGALLISAVLNRRTMVVVATRASRG